MIRLSTSMIYQNSLNGILNNESAVNAIGLQVSSGRRVVTPSDDPLAAGQSITDAENLSMTSNFADNRQVASDSLGSEDSTLQAIVNNLTSTLTNVVQAGDGTLSDNDRQALATELSNSRDALLGLANTTNGNGQFMFSGTTGDVAAFTQDPTTGNITYTGNAGQRVIQVDQNRQMAASDIGSDVFARATPGSSAYIVSGADTNTGTGVFSTATVSPGAASSTDTFQVDFSVDAAGATTYTVTDVTAGTPASAPVAYKDGDTINMGGVSMSISGAPANGDSFTVQSAQTADMNVFGTLNSLITALQAPAANDPVASAKLNNLLSTANKKLSVNLDNVSTVQASVGARENEVDALNATGSQRTLTQTNTLQTLTAVDYFSAISTMSERQLSLQASMAAFSAVKGTSLFSMN